MNRTQTLVLLFSCIGLACGEGSSNELGSRFLASADIGPLGGRLEVSAADSATLGGTVLIVPAGALTETVRVVVNPTALDAVPDDVEAIGPAVDFGPDGLTFDLPAEVAIVVDSALTTDDVEIHALESDGSRRVIQPTSVSGGLARFETTHFTTFQGGRRTPPQTCQPSDCGPQPGAPTYLCADGTTGGFTGRCLPTAAGCGWEVINCPAACTSNQDCTGQVCALRYDADNDGVNDAGTCEECASSADCAAGQTCDANFTCQGSAVCTISVTPSSLQFQTILGVRSTQVVTVTDTGNTGEVTSVSFSQSASSTTAFTTTFPGSAIIARVLQIPVSYWPIGRQDSGRMSITTNQSACGVIDVSLFGVGVPCRSSADCSPGQQCSPTGMCL